MGTESRSADAPILILTENTFESLDISDYLMRRGQAKIVSETKIEHCDTFLEDGAPPPRLVFFAFSLGVPAARNWLLAARDRGWRIILVNGKTTDPDVKGLPMLTRPFSTAHLDAVMDQIGK